MPSWLCLSRLVFGAGYGTRLYRLLIIAFLSTFQSTQARGRRRLLKCGPAMGRRKRSPSAEGTRRGNHERGSGDLARENFRFRKAVGMSEEIFLILVTFEHLTTQTYGT